MRPKIATLLKAAVSVGLLLLIFSRFSLEEMWRVTGSARFSALAWAAGIALLILGCKTLKWLMLGRQVDPAISPAGALTSLLAGMGFGLVTPSRVGEVARVAYLKTKDRIPLVGLVAVDRVLDLVVLLLAGGVAVVLVLENLLGIAIVVPTLLVTVLLFVPDLPGRVLYWLAQLSFMPGKALLSRVASGVSTLSGRTLGLILLLAAVTFGLGTYQFHWLLRSFHVDAPAAAAVTFPIITLAGVLPITIGGVGTREGATVLVLASFGISEPVAVNAALLSFFFNTLIPGVIGLLIGPGVRAGVRNGEEAANA